ncbi:DUF427 domain-containing protein [Phanerochaete sordida]|uniref:DUF427 domain-containing protein n=1 Tax=Phanerochaete sordida TaxID=48140 RepID=A0A9P3GWJ9_9APHY|nr:DUF427 domain-containing protein [Phanerochaete sordida]
MVTVTYNGTVLAQSDKPVKLEGNFYFPPESLNKDLLVQSPTKYTCPWKGSATYYNANIDGATVSDIAWGYLTPKSAATQIAGHLAFDKSKVSVA